MADSPQRITLGAVERDGPVDELLEAMAADVIIIIGATLEEVTPQLSNLNPNGIRIAHPKGAGIDASALAIVLRNVAEGLDAGQVVL